ncbi:Zygote defective protein 12, partial [Bienertia sinuspersici]
VPKHPLNYCFRVKQSDIFGVQVLLRKEESSYVNHSAVEMQSLKDEFSVVKKQNEDLRQKNQALESKFDDTAQSFKAIASHLAQVLKEVRDGNALTHLLDGAESAIRLIDTQVRTIYLPFFSLEFCYFVLALNYIQNTNHRYLSIHQCL